MNRVVANKHDIALSIITALLLALNTCPTHADISRTLRLNDANAPPLTTPQQDGFLDIIATEAFRRAGAKLVLIKLPAERALINANAGIEDGELVRIAGLEKLYPNLIRVPEKLIDYDFVAYTKKPGIRANWQAIRNYVVGHITGWKIYEHRLVGAKHIVTATNPTQLFQLLSRDRIEIALYARWMGQAFIQQLNLKDIHQLEPSLDSREMFIYLHKHHADLVPKIAESLRALKQEGFYEKIRQQKLAPYRK